MDRKTARCHQTVEPIVEAYAPLRRIAHTAPPVTTLLSDTVRLCIGYAETPPRARIEAAGRR